MSLLFFRGLVMISFPYFSINQKRLSSTFFLLVCVVSVVCAIDLNCYNLILVSVTSFLCGCECAFPFLSDVPRVGSFLSFGFNK